MEKCQEYRENFLGSPTWCLIICRGVGCKGDITKCECRDTLETRKRNFLQQKKVEEKPSEEKSSLET